MGVNTYDIGDKVTLKGRFGTNPTEVLSESAAGATTITVASVTGYAAPDKLIINPGEPTEELVTISSVAGRVITLSAALVHAHHVREAVWERTDPTTVTLRVKVPAGTITTYTYAALEITQDSQGVYSKAISLTAEGTYLWRWVGTGTAETAGEGRLTVRPSNFD